MQYVYEAQRTRIMPSRRGGSRETKYWGDAKKMIAEAAEFVGWKSLSNTRLRRLIDQLRNQGVCIIEPRTIKGDKPFNRVVIVQHTVHY